MGLNQLSVNPGDLRHVVTIQTLNRTTGDQWTVTDATDATAGWTTFYTCRAAIKAIGGLAIKEGMDDGGLASVSTHLIIVRWTSEYTIVAGMQVVFGAKVYRIQISRDWDERHRLFYLLCVEVPPV
jgi:SPP1 family predicted phage head-tail adaptor